MEKITGKCKNEVGDTYWLLNGKLHREEGPAIEWVNGLMSWYLDDIMITEEEHTARTVHLRTSLGKLILSGNYNKQLKE